MGLDNGIVVMIPEKELPKDFPTKLDNYDLEHLKETGALEVCYWRKCWGIRNKIVNLLHMDTCGEHSIEAEDIPAIIRILFEFLKPNYWEENGDSIWEYDEIISGLFNDILNLKWLKRYLEDHPDAECYFYDSY